MIFHTFGKAGNKIIVLIHGVLTPWQIWSEQINYFIDDYYIIVPALNGHISGMISYYQSVEEEAKEIENFLIKYYQGKVYALCGLSMGGAIANAICERGNIELEKMILDGAPLVKIPSLFAHLMTKQYTAIIHKSKQRDQKLLKGFEKNFLPSKYLEIYLDIADNMGDASIRNMVRSVCSARFHPNVNSLKTKILFLHGTKGNEIFSRKAARLMKRCNPDMEIKCFKGYEHCELAIYQAKQWIQVVDIFLQE